MQKVLCFVRNVLVYAVPHIHSKIPIPISPNDSKKKRKVERENRSSANAAIETKAVGLETVHISIDNARGMDLYEIGPVLETALASMSINLAEFETEPFERNPRRLDPGKEKTMKKSSDHILIIGSGAGGLSAGIALSLLGYRSTVVEKNRKPGGLMRGYSRDGVSCEVGVHYLGALDKGQVLRRIFEFLGIDSKIGLERMGENGIVDRYVFSPPLPGGPEIFDLPPDFQAYEDNLNRAFPGERDRIAQVMERVKQCAGKIDSLDFLFSSFADSGLFDHLDPLGKLLDDLGCGPALKSVLGVPSVWLGVPWRICPCFIHHMSLASYLFSSWRIAGGGTALADAFAERFRELGGEILTGDPVESILAENRKIKGVRLKSGAIVESSIVVGAVHPQIVVEMLPENSMKASYRKRVSELKNSHGIFAAHYLVDANSQPPLPHNVFKIGATGNGDLHDAKYYQILRTPKAGKSLFSVLTSGKSELWKNWENTKTGRRGEEYAEKKRSRADELLSEAREILGRFESVEFVDAYTPLTFRDWVGSPGGSAYGILKSHGQLLSSAVLNRTSVEGLYLAGQNAMAPGILGSIIGSLAAVRAIAGAERFKKEVVL